MEWREVSGLLKVPGKEIMVHSSGAASRAVVCEKCEQKYFYALRCDAMASERSVLFLENNAAEERATQAVDEKLAAALQDQILPVPCPKCGWYQADMVAQCREQYGTWMIFAGIASFFCLGAAFIGTMTTHTGVGPYQYSDVDRIVCLSSLVFFIILTVAFFWLRRIWSASYDPNEKDVAERIRIGQEKAFLAEADGEVRVRDKQLELQKQVDREMASSSRFDAMFSAGIKIVVPLVISIICFVNVYSMWGELRSAAATSEWPTTVATIDATGISTRQKEGKQSGSFYIPTVHYTYEVDGKAYSGTQIQISEPKFSNRTEADDMVRWLSGDQNLKASYDPQNPQRAVLLPGVPESLLARLGMLVIGGVLGLVVSLVIAIIYRRSFFPAKRPVAVATS